LLKSNDLIINITIAFFKLSTGIYRRGFCRLLYSIRYNYLRDTASRVVFKIIAAIALAI